ncbi:MAG: EamA family transporter [candidate division Zixibacteria bacterium]|nr:EamA family transporter [candidate division Zixibacteria bacterium]
MKAVFPMPLAQLYIAIIFCQLIFSATPLFTKIALNDFDPFTLGFLRFVIATMVLNLLMLIQGRYKRLSKKNLLKIIILGFLIAPVNQGFFLIGLEMTTPGHSALMFSMTPLFVYILAIPMLSEKFYFGKMGGILIALAGVIIILLDRNITVEPKFYWGDLLILMAVIAWALYIVIGKKVVAELGSIAAYSYSITAGMILFIPMGSYGTITTDFSQISVIAWIGLLYISLLTTGTAFPLWYWALKYMEASRLSIYMYIQTILAALWSYVFLSEQLTTNFIVGGITILAGVFITERYYPLKSTTSQSSSSSTG